MCRRSGCWRASAAGCRCFVTILANGTSGGPFVYVSAYAFFQLPHGLLAVSLSTTFAPELARRREGDSPPCAAALPRVTAHRDRDRACRRVVPRPRASDRRRAPPTGAFSADDAVAVADTLAAFAVGLLPFSLYLFALRAFTSRLDTRTPFLINCVENVVNIVLAFPLYAWLGIPGLALAFSLAYVVGVGVALYVLQRDLHGIDGPRLAATVVKAVLAAAVVTGVTWAISRASARREPARRSSPPPSVWWRGSRSTSGSWRCCGPTSCGFSPPCCPEPVRPAHACNDHPMGIRVVTDSACDLPAPLVQALGIEVVPLTIRFGDEEFVDRVELSADEFWDGSSVRRAARDRGAVARRVRGAVPPPHRRRRRPGSCASTCRRTSRPRCSRPRSRRPPSPASARCRSSTRRARRWSGQPVPRRARGAPPTATRWSRSSPRSSTAATARKLFATLDTLDHIRKGGRIGNARRCSARCCRSSRSSRSRRASSKKSPRCAPGRRRSKELAAKAAEHKVEHLAVLHGNAPDLEELLDLLDPIFPRDEIITGVVGPVIGTHAGPRVIGCELPKVER